MSRRTGKSERYVKLRYWLLDSTAWKSLPAAARALYLEIAKRYRGNNNGRIPYSVREAKAALHISADTARHMLGVLQDRGFIVCTKKGAFSLKVTKDASEWLLTEYDSDHPVAHATKEFMRWQPPEGADLDTLNRGPSHHRKSTTRYPHPDHTVPPAVPDGTPSRTVNQKKRHNGTPSRTVKTKNDQSTVPPVVHLQLPGRSASAASGGARPSGSAEAEERSQGGADGVETLGPPSTAEVVVVAGSGGTGGRGLNSVEKRENGRRPPPGDGWQIVGDQPPRGAVVWLQVVKKKSWHTPQVVEITDQFTPEQRHEFEEARARRSLSCVSGGGR